jgi:hypothetical protein
MDLLSKFPEYIFWNDFSSNTGMFEHTYDYKAIYNRCDIYKEELMSVVFHPRNCPVFHALGFDDDKVLPYDEYATLKVL